MAKQLFSGATADGTSQTEARVQPRVVSALFKYRKTGAGTCTLTLRDGVTGAEVKAFSVGSGNPDSGIAEVALPDTYYAVISSGSSTFSVDAWVDGDV